jgi:hypothetical protein
MRTMYETSTADTKLDQSDEVTLFYTVSDEELEAASGSRQEVSAHSARTNSCYSPCC